MKKFGIILATILWVGTAVKYITGSFLKDADVLSAFQTLDYSSINAKVVAYGTCDGIFDQELKEAYLKNILSELGIMAPYEIEIANDSEMSSVFCVKNSDNGSVKVEFVTADNTNHLGISLDLKNNMDYVYDYEGLIKDIFSAEGIKGKVNVYLEGRLQGALNYEERNLATNTLLESLGANVVSENKDSDNYTIYAYSNRIEEYVKSIGRKININISASYDETKNETVIYLATPMNNLDY